MSKNYENMSNEEIKEQLEWSDHHEFSYNYAIWAFEEIDRLNNIIDELEKYIIDEIDDAQEELNAILQGNDLEYKNECTKEFNCIKNALDMLLDKIKELKENNK